MKFNSGETLNERIERVKHWHKWFAWYPVRVGAHDIRWLCYVERSAHYGYAYGSDWWASYRPVNGKQDKELYEQCLWQWEYHLVGMLICLLGLFGMVVFALARGVCP